MSTFHQATSRIQISGIRKFTELVKRYPDAVTLTIGQPHFATPEHVRLAGIRAIEENRTSYTSNRGLPELLAAIRDYYLRLYGVDYHPEREILVTVGATHALDISLRTLLEPGDEVLIPGPAYPGYEPIVWLAGATPIFVDTRAHGFKLTPDTLRDHLTPKTKVLIIASPANPTGVTYTREELEALAAVLRETNTFVIADEIYSELRFDGPPVSFATMPGMRDKTILIQGLSKSHSMTGWRIGFTMAPEAITNELVKVLQYSVTCATSISQYAALEALTHGASDAGPMREAYQANLETVLGVFSDLDVSITPPGGAFYAFPSIEPFRLPSSEFATRMLDEARVAVVPGDAFGEMGEGYIRLSYACDPRVLREGLERFARFIEKIRPAHDS